MGLIALIGGFWRSEQPGGDGDRLQLTNAKRMVIPKVTLDQTGLPAQAFS